MRPALAYKLVPGVVWRAQFRAPLWRFVGTLKDRRDGFIHLSTPAQVMDTYDRYFSGRRDIWLIGVDLERVSSGPGGHRVVYEPARSAPEGDVYPHIYGAIERDAVILVRKVSEDKEQSNYR
jgi:uncharacterized protein (DUF952 family)